jgi:hypothetical protein
MLDVGASDEIALAVVEKIDLPPRKKGRGKGAGRGTTKLTASRKREISQRLAASIVTLSETYQTALDFRDLVLLKTPRGRQWKREYDRYLSELYLVASGDHGLAYETALTWLEIHPFVVAVVAGAGSANAEPAARPKLSAKRFARFEALIDRFHEGSSNEPFRAFLDELKQEMLAYKGATPSEALARLRSTPARK